MRTITEYRAEISDLMKQLGDMKAVCIAEGRDSTQEERDKARSILSRIDELDDIVKTEERVQGTEEYLKQSSHSPVKPNPQESAEERNKQTKKDSFRSFGEQMAAVYKAGVPGGTVDPRLLNRAATGLNEAVPSDGGFLVQQDFASQLMELIWQGGVLGPMCNRIPISGNANSIKIPGVDETSRADGSRAGGIRAYWKDEADEKTKSKPKFREIELNLKKLIGLCYATDELIMDAAALGPWLQMAFVNEFGFKIDDAIVNGDGAGKPLGILNAGCLVSVAKESGQSAATVVYENVVKMWSRLFARSQPNAVWLINQNVWPQLHTMSLAVGTGGVPVFLPPGGASGSPYGSLFGRPVMPIEQCQTVGTVGDIILADFQNGYVLAEKGGMQADMSIHVRFVYDESVFRFVLRLDGQPYLASAITPFKGGTNYTQSHFVALATRS